MGYQQAVASFGAPSAAVNGFRNLSGGYDITGGQGGGIAGQGALTSKLMAPTNNKPWPLIY
jgi:hypothetical protein